LDLISNQFVKSCVSVLQAKYKIYWNIIIINKYGFSLHLNYLKKVLSLLPE